MLNCLLGLKSFGFLFYLESSVLQPTILLKQLEVERLPRFLTVTKLNVPVFFTLAATVLVTPPVRVPVLALQIASQLIGSLRFF